MDDISRNQVMAFVNDLMFKSKINASAKELNLDIEYMKSYEIAIKCIVDGRPIMILIDLDHKSGRSFDLIDALKSNVETKDIKLIGYISHVKNAERDRAIELGCDTVYPKSKFSANLKQILQEHINGE